MQINIKVVGIGSSFVGKTTFFNNIVGITDNITNTTIGVDYHCIKHDNMNIMLWDTGGCEKYNSITKSYLRNKDLYLIFFDLSNFKSFQKVYYYIELIGETNNLDELNDRIIFVGTKKDKQNYQIENYNCDFINMDKYFEISYKDKKSVNLLFDFIKIKSKKISNFKIINKKNYIDISKKNPKIKIIHVVNKMLIKYIIYV